MQSTQTEDIQTDGVPVADMVSAWPTPARHAPADSLEPEELEREIKFAVSSLGPIEGRLQALDEERARSIGVTCERNCVLDTDGEDLRSRDERLRVREIEGVTGVRVTWKGPANTANGVRRREEREFHADDRDACLAVLSNLGLRPVQPYEKTRASWQVDDVIVCLDTLPFGCFVEIELTPAVSESEESSVVESVVTLLGIEDARPIRASYARLQQEWKELLDRFTLKADKTSR